MIVTMAEMFVGICVKFAVPMLISENTPVVHCMCTTGQQCHIATIEIVKLLVVAVTLLQMKNKLMLIEIHTAFFHALACLLSS